MIGRLNLSGGLDINGIIEEYKVYSGGNVSAGDFVSFVNELEESPEGNVITPEMDSKIQNTAYLGAKISAVQLTDNKIFIAHVSNSSNKYLYGIIININNDGTLSIGTDTQLSTTVSTGVTISAVKLTPTKVFIAHSSSSSLYLYGMIVDVNNNDVITHGVDTQIDSNSKSGTVISTTVLNETKILVANSHFNSSSEAIPYAVIVNVKNENEISYGSITKLDYEENGNVIDTTLLTDTKVFITYNYASSSQSYYLEANVLTISGNTITKGAGVQLAHLEDPARVLSVVKINENKVFLAHTYEYTNRYLYGRIIKISNEDEISSVNSSQLSSDVKTGNTIFAVRLSPNSVFIAHSSSSSLYLYGMIVKVSNNDVMTIGVDTQLSSTSNTANSISSVICSNKVYIAHNQGNSTSSNYLYLMPVSIGHYVTNIKTLSSTNELIRGVAKQNGNSGNTIDVFVPDFN